MEKVVRKICLDTDILIQMMRNDESVKAIMASFDSTFHTTSINVFEIWQGHRKGEETLELLSPIVKLDFDEKSAFVAGDIQRKLLDNGQVLDIRDVFVASACISNNAELLTLNKKHFERMKKFGLKLAN